MLQLIIREDIDLVIISHGGASSPERALEQLRRTYQRLCDLACLRLLSPISSVSTHHQTHLLCAPEGTKVALEDM